MRHLKAYLFTVVWMVLVSLISHLGVGQAPTLAALRLSWKTTGEKVRIEMQEDPNLPAHMRAPGGAFKTVLLPYRLEIELDGRKLLSQRYTAPGVQHDRPLSVLQELALEPGRRRLRVTFLPDDPGAPPESPRYEFDEEVELRAGRVALVSLDPVAGRLLFSP